MSYSKEVERSKEMADDATKQPVTHGVEEMVGDSLSEDEGVIFDEVSK